MPEDYPTIPGSVYDENKLVKLAREIAMGIDDIPDILFNNGLTQREFAEIQQLPHFNNALAGCRKEWDALSSTEDRVRVKAGAVLEQYMPELYSRLNDRSEPLMAKMKALEHLSKLAGFGDRDIPNAGSPGDRVQVIINLGADVKLEYQKQLPSKVIEHVPSITHSFEESLDACTNKV
jgi:hypothetical protein